MYTTYYVNSNNHMFYRYLHLHVATFQQHECLSIDKILLLVVPIRISLMEVVATGSNTATEPRVSSG